MARVLQEWTSRDVEEWLRSLKLEEHTEAFSKHNIMGEQLLSLDKNKLSLMGLTKLGHVLRLQKGIEQLRSPPRSPRSTYHNSEHESQFISLCLDKMTVGVKCVYYDDISIVRLDPVNLRYKCLVDQIYKIHRRNLEIRYKDKEGDIVRIQTDAQLQYAYMDWHDGSKKERKAWRMALSDPDR